MTVNKRGGAGRGQGRKAPAGEVRKVRPFKATDAEWGDCKLVTPEKVRQQARQQSGAKAHMLIARGMVNDTLETRERMAVQAFIGG